MKHPRFYSFLAILVIATILLSACGPTSMGGGESFAPIPTMQANATSPQGHVAVPTPTMQPEPGRVPEQLYKLYPEADPNYVAAYNAVEVCRDTAAGKMGFAGLNAVFPCANEQLLNAATTLSVLTLGTFYALQSGTIAAGGGTIVAVIETTVGGVATITGVVVSAPVLMVGALFAITGYSFYAASQDPTIISPEIMEWSQGRYPNKTRMLMDGQLVIDEQGNLVAAGQTSVVNTYVDEVGIAADIDVETLLKRHSYERTYFKNQVAVIVTDDPILAAESAVIAIQAGLRISGIYLSCDNLRASGNLYSTVYFLDVKYADCRSDIRAAYGYALVLIMFPVEMPGKYGNLSEDLYMYWLRKDAKNRMQQLMAEHAKIFLP